MMKTGGRNQVENLFLFFFGEFDIQQQLAILAFVQSDVPLLKARNNGSSLFFFDVFEIDMQKDACKKAQMRIKPALGRKLFQIKIVKMTLPINADIQWI